MKKIQKKSKMGAYFILQFKPRGPNDGWKLFRKNSRIQVYYSKEKAEQDSENYSKERKKQFRFKSIKIHPRIERPRCRWEDIN